MKNIRDSYFEGERPLFESHGLRLERVTIGEGESAIKECSDIVALSCLFEGKYPFWHVHGFQISNCHFKVGARSALWYSDNLLMTDTVIDGPKMFREMENIRIRNVAINDADETFWKCKNLDIKNLEIHDGTYPFMLCENIRIDGLKSYSKYVFQYVKNVEIHNSFIDTKDAFGEVENVTIYDSKNLHLVNCHITGEQVLCYAEGLIIENCTFGTDCDRMFEYSTLQADIKGSVTNIKNPTSGHIIADEIGSVTIDDNIRLPANCIIETRKG